MLSVLLKSLAATCGPNSGFLGFPNWFRNLPGADICQPSFDNINQIWLIVANITEIVLRVAGLLAIGFVIYGGIAYIMSQGNPERIAGARNILVNAVVGLAIAILATTIVSFIANRFS